MAKKQIGENVFLDGKKIGVVHITPDKGVDMWAVVDGLIRDYTKVHPQEVFEILQGAKELRYQHQVSRGFSKEKTLQAAVVLPVGLKLLIDKYYPEIFKKKEVMDKFRKRYGGFATVN